MNRFRYINNCTSVSTDYYLNLHLSRSFINAYFDKAIQMVHEEKIKNTDEINTKTIDLSGCLYE